MIAKQLFDAGRVTDAIQSLGVHLRDHPSDTQHRIFLFELLCFSGQYDRAEKQLSVLAQGGTETELGAVLYYSALHAERTRHEMFGRQALPKAADYGAPIKPRSGILNGKPFSSITDADSELGMRLEVFAAGSYMWIPFEYIASLKIEPPRNLRDTLWPSGYVQTESTFNEKDLGEVLIPVIYPFSWKHPDENAWLGRITAWAEDESGREYPLGQKLLLVDNEEVPFLEIRNLEFASQQIESI